MHQDRHVEILTGN